MITIDKNKGFFFCQLQNGTQRCKNKKLSLTLQSIFSSSLLWSGGAGFPRSFCTSFQLRNEVGRAFHHFLKQKTKQEKNQNTKTKQKTKTNKIKKNKTNPKNCRQKQAKKTVHSYVCLKKLCFQGCQGFAQLLMIYYGRACRHEVT